MPSRGRAGGSGRGRGIRTPDPLVPNQMRYQTALCPDPGLRRAPALRKAGHCRERALPCQRELRRTSAPAYMFQRPKRWRMGPESAKLARSAG